MKMQVSYRGRIFSCPYPTKTLLIMKLLAVFMLAACLQVTATGYTQQKITLAKRDAPLEQLFREIKKQTGVQFFYRNEWLQQAKTVTIHVKDAGMEQVLNICFADQPFTYTMLDSAIVVRWKEMATEVMASPPPQSITGIVKDEEGMIVEGAAIAIKKLGKATVTNNKGEFTFSNVPEGLHLIAISFVGYKAAEKAVLVTGSKPAAVTIVLQRVANALSEMVVTGYQSFTNRTAPGVIATLKPEDITQVGAISVDQMLEGKIAGLAVTGNIGNPGAPPKIRIRGTTSINGDQEPIWVIDGVIWEEAIPVRNRDLASLDETSLLMMVGGSVAGLNPKDIESINVLKDAAATAIYGVRAANGVVVVTTKKGQSGTPRVNYSTDLRTSLRPSYNNFNLMNSADRVRLSQDIVASGLSYPMRPGHIGYEGALMDLRNRNITQEEFDRQVAYFASLNTDWFNELFRNSFSQNQNLSVSGGSGKTTYYFSGSMYSEKGNAKVAALDRYTASARLNMKLRDNLNLDVKVGGNIRQNNGYHSSINPFTYATTSTRALPVRNADGTYAFYDKKNSVEVNNPGLLSYNILNEIDQTGNQSKTREMNAQVSLRYDFLKHFVYEGTAFYATNTTNVDEWATERSYYIAYNYRGYDYGVLDASHPNVDQFAKIPNGGVLKPYRTSTDNYTLRNSFTFNKHITQTGNLNLLLGTEIRSVRQKGLAQLLPGYFPERGGLFTVPVTTAYQTAVSARDALTPPPRLENNVSNFFSVYMAGVYNISNKYIFNVNGRFDGSNKFGKDPKYRYLPTFSSAFKWIASDENFMRALVDKKVVDFIAVNASYGLQGNIKSDAYPSLVTRVDAIDRFGRPQSSVVSLGNPGLRWEKTYSYNLGLEFGLFKRFNVRADYYRKMGNDLLIEKLVSLVEGRETILLNSGNMVNQGIEITLSGYAIRKKDFTWRFNIVGANNSNKITKAYVSEPGLQSQLDGKAVIEGQPVGTLYSYAFAELDAKGVPLYYINDGNNGKARSMSELQRRLVTSGSLNPTINGGIDNSFRYKDFTLTVSLTYSLGAHKRLPQFYNNPTSTPTLPFPENNFSSEYVNRWRQPGDEQRTNIPVLMDASSSLGYLTELPGYTTMATIGGLYNNSDLRTVKISYMRVRALNLNYNLPQTITKRIGASAASVYFSAQNLWFIAADKSKLNGIDPEVVSDSYAMPLPKIFNLGVNVSF
jgi:TonB-linked SusC/RagA family outer membrane protein